MSNWKTKTIPVTATAIAEAVDAMRFVIDRHYITALNTELEVCLAGCKTDAERTQVFLWLLPHLKRQIERKCKQDAARFYDRLNSGRYR